MMKIGVITFHRVLNYGAVLQTYALQKCLQKLGYECVVLDYRKPEFENEYRNLKFNRISPRAIYHTLKCWMVRKKDKAFLEFIKDNIQVSEPCNTIEDLAHVADKCDFVITGSDQVFNYITTHNDGHYFLDFIEESKKKYSYAASFGITDISNEAGNRLKSWLKDFQSISVREIEAKEYLEDLLGRPIELHVDPSFLLEMKEWMKFNQGVSGRNYVLVYSVARSQELIDGAEKLAQKYGLEVRYIKYTYEKCGSAKVITDASPTEFINLIMNAQFVVTNLFHGVAFSMILQKNFYIYLQKNVKTNSRLMYLLNRYDLSDRIVYNDYLPERAIDYASITAKIEEDRNAAIEYLKGIGERGNARKAEFIN